MGVVLRTAAPGLLIVLEQVELAHELDILLDGREVVIRPSVLELVIGPTSRGGKGRDILRGCESGRG